MKLAMTTWPRVLDTATLLRRLAQRGVYLLYEKPGYNLIHLPSGYLVGKLTPCLDDRPLVRIEKSFGRIRMNYRKRKCAGYRTIRTARAA